MLLAVLNGTDTRPSNTKYKHNNIYYNSENVIYLFLRLCILLFLFIRKTHYHNIAIYIYTICIVYIYIYIKYIIYNGTIETCPGENKKNTPTPKLKIENKYYYI